MLKKRIPWGEAELKRRIVTCSAKNLTNLMNLPDIFTQLPVLLEKAAVINLRQEFVAATDRFNIFTILLTEGDEVNLHSRFLYELLNPAGVHGLGHTFLRSFVEECGLPPLSYDTVQVRREHANIDLLIQDNYHSVIIENKIWASDQHEQLKRYHDYVVTLGRQPHLYYLTLDGRDAPPWSVGGLKQEITPLSYSEHINRWLSVCIKESAAHPTLRETLVQYQKLIRRLSGAAMENSERQAVIDLMNQGQNAEYAALLVRNWMQVRYHTEWNFWQELKALAQTAYEVSDNGLFDNDPISKMIWGKKNKNPWYGLSFRIATSNGASVKFKIERSEGPMYYGLLNVDECSQETKSIMSAAIHRFGMMPTEAWIGHKHNSAGLDFENFNRSQATQQLANRDKRQFAIRNLWSETTAFIDGANDALSLALGETYQPLSRKS